jgi:glutamate racemase
MTIGVFDSGLGGLSVLREIRALLPDHDLLYLADSAYCPYGPRSLEVIRARALVCANFLMAQGTDVIVVACNTASSAAAQQLREQLPVPIVAMEPGVKPAVAASQNKRIGVLATESTLDSERFVRLVVRYASGMQVVSVPAPGLVTLVEDGELIGPRAEAMVQGYLAPLRAAEVDVIVLGCTHFAFLQSLIGQLYGSDVAIIDTGPAVAAQTARVVAGRGERSREPGPRSAPAQHFFTTGEPGQVLPALRHVWRSDVALMQVQL